MAGSQESAPADAFGNVARWYDDEAPRVSIIILNFNKADLTYECLEHIWRHTAGVRYEIVVVDNGSRAEDFSRLAHKPGHFRLLRVGQNRFFGEGNNIGAEQARGEFICFLNNDAFVTAGWLRPLCDVLDNAWNAGGVGPRFVYPDGRLQEIGSFIDEEGRSCQVGKFSLYNPGDLEDIRIVDYCSAACLMVRRHEFTVVGGFDLIFEPGYYEDADLCFKLSSLGRFIYCCPKSQIVHLEHATMTEYRDILGAHTVEQNRALFRSRWKGFLQARSENREARLDRSPPSSTENRPAPVNAGSERIIAFYTEYDLTAGGGERYLLSAAVAATALGKVFLITELPYSQLRLASLSRALNLDLSRITLLTRDRVPEITPVEICVIMANEILPPVRGFGRRNYYLCQFPFPISDMDFSARWPHLDSIQSYVCYSGFVRHHIEQEHRRINVRNMQVHIICPPVHNFAIDRKKGRPSESLHLLMIGRFFAGGHNKRHDVGIEGLKRLRNSGYDAVLHLVGSVSASNPANVQRLTDLRQSAEGYPIHFYVNASHDTLVQLLELCTIYLHATGFDVDTTKEPYRCEHFGISVLEAMSAGCVPFVVNNGGPAEFVRDGHNGFQYSSLDELVSKLQKLANDDALFSRVGCLAQDTACQFSEEVFAETWRRLLAWKAGGGPSTACGRGDYQATGAAPAC